MTKILISETQLERLSKIVLKEQSGNRQRTFGPKEFVEMEMTNSLNDIIIDKQSEISSALKVSIVNQRMKGVV